MSKLNVDQKSIKDLLNNKKADFLIPDYQRPYAWGEKECETLWEDLFSFAFPENDYEKFNSNDEYFLGPIVTFTNADGKQEVIDGQQRLTTLMLLLRAFYERGQGMKDQKAIKTREIVAKCIWKTDEFEAPDMDELKINSEVATDNDKEEFLGILKSGKTEKTQRSRYADNYRYFESKIDAFLNEYPTYFAYFPNRILANCILLPIEAESQETALRIFSTLNDRGMPLSDADIFKAQFYKYYASMGEKDFFISEWKNLDALCNRIFHPQQGTPMDELFTRYMYFRRAKKGIKSSTTEALRKFFEKNNYEILRDENTLTELKSLADFWNDVYEQNPVRFSSNVLKLLFVLNYAPNGMWAYLTSVYYLHNKKADNTLEEEPFINFLKKTIGFIWAYAVINPGLMSLRTPVYSEMVNIVNGSSVAFMDYQFEEETVKSFFGNYYFNNYRPITKAMLTWWAFENPEQQLLSTKESFDIEHIYARNLQEKEHGLSDQKSLESLGNKVLLESRINIRASDYKFSDKKMYYRGYTTGRGVVKERTNISELVEIAEKQDFTEADITARNQAIVHRFVEFLKCNGLCK